MKKILLAIIYLFILIITFSFSNQVTFNASVLPTPELTLETNKTNIMKNEVITLTAHISYEEKSDDFKDLKIYFFFNDLQVGSALVDESGTATYRYTVKSMAITDYSFYASFKGNDSYSKVTSNVISGSFVTKDQVSLSIITSKETGINKHKWTFNVQITSDDNHDFTNEYLEFYDEKELIGKVKIENNLASIVFTSSDETKVYHEIYGYYDGNEDYSSSETKHIEFGLTKASISCSETIVKSNESLTANVSLVYGSKMLDAATLEIYIDNKYRQEIVTKDGLASISYDVSSLNIGEHSLIVVFEGTDAYMGTTSNEIKFEVTPFNKPIIVASTDHDKYTTSSNVVIYGHALCNNQAIVNLPLQVLIDDEIVDTISTDNEGMISYVFEANDDMAGEHTYQIKFLGNSIYLASESDLAKYNIYKMYYYVNFDMQGYLENPTQTMVAEGDTIPVPDEPELSGYYFKGWYTDAECTTSYDFNTKVTSNVTLYAKFEKIDYTTLIILSTGVGLFIIFLFTTIVVTTHRRKKRKEKERREAKKHQFVS